MLPLYWGQLWLQTTLNLMKAWEKALAGPPAPGPAPYDPPFQRRDSRIVRDLENCHHITSPALRAQRMLMICRMAIDNDALEDAEFGLAYLTHYDRVGGGIPCSIKRSLMQFEFGRQVNTASESANFKWNSDNQPDFVEMLERDHLKSGGRHFPKAFTQRAAEFAVYQLACGAMRKPDSLHPTPQQRYDWVVRTFNERYEAIKADVIAFTPKRDGLKRNCEAEIIPLPGRG